MSIIENVLLPRATAGRKLYIAGWLMCAFWYGTFGVFAVTTGSPVFIIVVFAIISYVWSLFAAARSRDAGRSGAFGLLTLIPVLGIAVMVWLGLMAEVEQGDTAMEG